MSWIKLKIIKSKNKKANYLKVLAPRLWLRKQPKSEGEFVDSKNYLKFFIHNNPKLTDLLQCDIGRINFLTSEINNKQEQDMHQLIRKAKVENAHMNFILVPHKTTGSPVLRDGPKIFIDWLISICNLTNFFPCNRVRSTSNMPNYF